MESIIHEQYQLFNSSRWPKKPYCSDNLETGLRIRSLASAIQKPYIQANPPHLRVWSIFDIDRSGGAVAWEDAMLPPPSWAAANRENGHAHLVWGLTVPVLVDSPDMRQQPMRYLCAVEAAFRAKLESDSGYSGLITKNPVHPLWRTLKGPVPAYGLDELSEWVDLPKFAPKRKPEEVGLGRNVECFDWLRRYAYRSIRRYKVEVRNFIEWQSHLNCKALERNGDFKYPLDGREVWQIAKSVAKWTWQKFDLTASDAKFSALQAHRGRLGGIANGNRHQEDRVSARLMAAQGITQRKIAANLGVALGTVVRWLNEAAAPTKPTALRS